MYKIKHMVSIGLLCTVLTACDDNAPKGPDLTGIAERDLNYFNEIYNRCNINNSTNDCNCIAQVNVQHRGDAYDAYVAEYDSKHKPELEAEIQKNRTTLEEKTRNRSDERVLEALNEDLHRLEAKLAAGIDNIDDFELPFLPAGATDHCKLAD